MNIYEKNKFIISNDMKKESCISVNIYEKNKFIVSNTKHIGNKSNTALESKYSYRPSQMHLHLMNEMKFRLFGEIDGTSKIMFHKHALIMILGIPQACTLTIYMHSEN